MIAIFETRELAQAYCDERSAARGCPVPGAREWDIPRDHPTDGRACAAVDPLGSIPECLELTESLPSDWEPPQHAWEF